MFLTSDFLLTTETAKRLYHGYAECEPICDYHCHIDPRDIYEDKKFDNLGELWLGGDHYKWRIMRSNGVDERYITGDTSYHDKFVKFAEALPRCIGNPMYHWCHLELKNYFGYEGVLNGETAEAVWELANEKLKSMSVRSIIKQSGVAMIGTTDDPASDLRYHKLLADEGYEVKVCPSFRPDCMINIHKPDFLSHIARLSSACGYEIRTAADLKRAFTDRIEYFASVGCRAADHGLDYVMYREADDGELEAIYASVLAGNAPSLEDTEKFQTALLLHCAREYARLGLVMQLHFSCTRNPNSKMFSALGADTGFDSIAVTDSCASLCRLADALEREGKLPRTILYSLNPADNAWLDTLIGAFQDSSIPGKLQHGSAWWFNDHKTGMREQLISLANLSVLGNFVGMLTDSRSFLSYARHEYFRRILCALVGEWIEGGEYPSDLETAGALVSDISFGNAKRYFGI